VRRRTRLKKKPEPTLRARESAPDVNATIEEGIRARPCWRRRLALPAKFLTVLCALATLLPWLSRALAGQENRVAWAIDLAAHWQVLYVAVLLPCALVAAVSQRRWLVALLAALVPWWSASPRLAGAPASGDAFVVAAANVHVDNRDPAALLAWLSVVNPDVVVLTEVSPAFAQALRSMRGYSHRQIEAADHPFGMAVLSRHPMQAATLRDDDGIVRIEARVDAAGTCIDLIALHPMPPISPHFHAARDALLRGVAERSVRAGRPTLVVGDLNATPWSSAFASLEDHGLRRAGPLWPTWPSVGDGWIGIPIDHLLASAHWRVRSAQIGPELGSDHRPIAVRLVAPQIAAVGCANAPVELRN
jgi:endonuclease/exonuclease/phosphatase (EEP) superfamily protein YafD